MLSTQVCARPAESAVVRHAMALRGRDGRRLVPDVIGVSAGRPILRTVPGPRLDLLVRDGAPGLGDLLAQVGRVLAIVHAAPPPGGAPVRVETPPWEPLGVTAWRGLSVAQRRLVGRLHGDADLRSAGRATRDALGSGTAWCHGDARTNNVVVDPDGVPLLIDWENSGVGRPEADLGAMCAAVVTDVLGGWTAPAGASARDSLRQLAARFRRGVRSLCSGYSENADIALDQALLARAVGCAMLSRAFMRGGVATHDRVVATLERMGCALLLDPDRWEVVGGTA